MLRTAEIPKNPKNPKVLGETTPPPRRPKTNKNDLIPKKTLVLVRFWKKTLETAEIPKNPKNKKTIQKKNAQNCGNSKKSKNSKSPGRNHPPSSKAKNKQKWPHSKKNPGSGKFLKKSARNCRNSKKSKKQKNNPKKNAQNCGNSKKSKKSKSPGRNHPPSLNPKKKNHLERGGGFRPELLDFLDFLEFLQFWALFFWNEIFVFGFFGFSAVSSVFFQNLTRTRVFFGMRSFLFVFGLRGGGGGFSQDFWIFGFFGIPAVLGPFFLEWNFCFWTFWIFCSFERFFFKTLPEPGFFLEWGHFCCFWPSRRGGWFLPGLLDFLDFLEFLQFWALFFWNEIFAFGLFGFSAVSSVFFFKTLPEPGFFLAWGHFVVFGLRGGGGGFSQDFWIFWIFWNSCSSGPFFFGMKFLLLDFLDFLQFRAFFFSKPYENQGFFFEFSGFFLDLCI